ncbi:hypothetical protein [Altererythrobacter sp. GH1-8]|uniref:hypothetical protein n=1 Tax=Altererythrobacter sp. GH1-8 TaxID=3349333 RepID=UPI00374CD664
MTLRRAFWISWLGGLVIFALLRIPHGPLAIAEVPGGILDHQAAMTAAEVDRIQAAWAAAGLMDHAWWGMVGDFVFIGVYGLGALLGGLLLRREAGFVAAIGLVVSVAAVAFLVTDYVETICQFIQLSSSGNDSLAATAAYVQPIKIAAWIVSFLGLVSGVSLSWWRARSQV